MTQASEPQIENGVLVAPNGELFLAGKAHNVFAYATGELRVDPTSIQNLRDNIEFRHDRARALGIPYMHLIAPEKFKVEPDGFPIKSPRSIADSYLEGGCQFIYPIEELRPDAQGRSYYRTDTHWAQPGRMRMARLIGLNAGLDPASVNRTCQMMFEDMKAADKPRFGDLGSKLVPPQGEPHLILKWRSPVKMFDNGLAHVNGPMNDGSMTVVYSQHETAADKILLIFGDSYLHTSLANLAYLFKRIVFCRARFWHEEVVTSVQPDVVVSQMAERYLSFVSPDAVAPPFHMIPQLLGRPMTPTPEATIAIAQALSGRRTPGPSPVRTKRVMRPAKRPACIRLERPIGKQILVFC